MKGGNIKSILDRFVNENYGRKVTTRIVGKWITKTIGVDISPYVLGQRLGKHKSFQFVKRTNKGRLYYVVAPLSIWMDELKTV